MMVCSNTLSLSVDDILGIQGTFMALLKLPGRLCNTADQTMSGVFQTISIERFGTSTKYDPPLCIKMRLSTQEAH